MSKWVNVRAISVKECMVEIKDDETEEDALKIAQDMMIDYDEFSSESVDIESIENYKRHADEIFSIPA